MKDMCASAEIPVGTGDGVTRDGVTRPAKSPGNYRECSVSGGFQGVAVRAGSGQEVF